MKRSQCGGTASLLNELARVQGYTDRIRVPRVHAPMAHPLRHQGRVVHVL